MAKFISLSDKHTLYLHGHHTFGRLLGKVDSVVEGDAISKIHASVEWNGLRWTIKDLSRNGVWLNRKKLERLVDVPLKAGQKISFAEQKNVCFKIEDLSPPQALLINQKNSGKHLILESHNLLPNEQKPEALLYQRENSLQWCLQGAEAEQETLLANQQVISIAGEDWVTFFPVTNVQTAGLENLVQENIQDYLFQFTVSLDEESVGIQLSDKSKTIDLGNKAYYYLLLYLARQRLADAELGLPMNDQGWVGRDQLVKDLGMEETHINIHIFRIRKILAGKLPQVAGLDKLVDRARRGHIRLGLAPQTICVIKGNAVTGAHPIAAP